jgi:hypothetical protein
MAIRLINSLFFALLTACAPQPSIDWNEIYLHHQAEHVGGSGE